MVRGPGLAGGQLRPLPGERVEAWRMEFFAPVASFRDPLFPRAARSLPLPPPSTVRGMLAAASGAPAEAVPLGMAAWTDGAGTDLETYHPIAADGTNPAVAGRVRSMRSDGRALKGGTTVRERPFLAGVHLTIWLAEPDGGRLHQALRRPRWPLRLGRSQDIVHVHAMTPVVLEGADTAAIGHALAPLGAHRAGAAHTYRMPASISPDRHTTTWADYLWCDEPAGPHAVHGAFRDSTWDQQEEQAVWLLAP